MLRSFCLSLLGLAILAEAASAQTTPAAKSLNKKTPAQKAAARTGSTPADPARGSGTNDNGVGQSGYAAPGEPITPPSASGKNTATYDGKPAKPAPSSTSLGTPK
jgi:hypothetical protein